MPVKELEELEKIPIRFYKSDLEWVRQEYPNYGYNRLVRNLLRRFRTAAERRGGKPNEQRDGSPRINLTDDDLEALGLSDGESSEDSPGGRGSND